MNLFFVEPGSPYSYDLARELVSRGFKVSHATSYNLSGDLDPDLAALEAKVVYVPDLYQPEEMLKRYGHYYTLLNADILTFFQAIERDFYILSDRTNYAPLSFRRRKILFNDLIRFWLGYLQSEDIDCVYFPYTPHAPWELVLMQACRYLGKPYCYLSHTAINNRSIFRTEYEYLAAVPQNYLDGFSADEIRKEINAALLEDFEEESVVTNVVKLENDTFNRQLGTNVNIENYKKFFKPENASILSRVLRVIRETVFGFARSLCGRRTFRFPVAMDDNRSDLKWTLVRKLHKWKAKKLKSYYADKAVKLDYDRPYIYFPLHLQPELTSQPEARIFEDQLLALETLLAALPEGWKIYLKENPRQFDATINTVSGMGFRDQFDIGRFAAYKDVFLVPQSEKSEKLISNAKITVTLSGTAGWESLNLGKPCMVFSYPWYSPCPSCFVVQNPEDVRKALVKAGNKSRQDVELDLLKFLHFYQDKLAVATLHAPSDVSYNTRPYKEILMSHAEALRVFFVRQKPGILHQAV